MSNDLLLACTCGTVRGIARDLGPGSTNHVVCYCDDCQAFAWALDRASDVLDAHGGSTILQMSPARLEITQGIEELQCLRLSPKGMVRWYTRCCNTPVGNTLVSPGPPFIGMLRPFVGAAADGRPADAVVGPIRERVQKRWAKGDVSAIAIDRVPVRMLLRMSRLLLGWWVRGDSKRSPLRDASGAPRVAPRVLSADELRDLKARAAS